jgi:hypothetical protein
MLQQSLSILLLSLVSAHCGQLVEPGKLVAVNGEKFKYGKFGFSTFGQSSAPFARPLADWTAPARYGSKGPEEVYKQMLEEGMSVKDLFIKTATEETVVRTFDHPPEANGGYGNLSMGGDTCGYYDPTFQVELLDTNPQSSSTGNNHIGPAEVWIDDVRTHHTANLLASQPEVLSREKFNCNKDWCQYKWYWIAFRAEHNGGVSKSSFSMWVNCAMIKGNGKAPIPHRPNGQWAEDPRGDYRKGAYVNFNTDVPDNKIGLPISVITTEEVDPGYSSLPVGTVNATVTGTYGNTPVTAH